MKFMPILIAALMSWQNTFAQTTLCDTADAPETTRVYFVNGMFTDATGREQARLKLASAVGVSNYAYRATINSSEDLSLQLYEVGRQRFSNIEPREIWRWVKQQTNSKVPQEFTDTIAEKIVEAANSEVSTDPELAAMVEQFYADVYSGKKVLLVAHSQGNFYANNAYNHIRGRTPEVAKSIGIVAIATPASRLAGNLYLQNSKDAVINAVRSITIDVPAANTSIIGKDSLNHGFLETYMLREEQKIVAMIKSTIASIKQPKALPDCDERVAVIETLIPKNIGARSADLVGRLSNGKSSKAWIIYSRTASNVSCVSSGQSGANSYTAPVDVSNTVTDLMDNSLYYVRACAKGTVGDLSDGGLRQFVTKKNSGKVAKAFPEFISKDFFELKAVVLEGNLIDTWFVRGPAGGFHNPSCNGSSYDGVGNLSVGDTAYSARFSNLEPNTLYLVRACAKGSDGITNAGPVNGVRTNAIPVRPCSNQAFQGGTSGLSVIYDLGSQGGFAKVTFQTYSIPDRLRILKHDTNQVLLTTNGFVSGEYTSSFGAGGVDKVDVYVTGNSNTNTEWALTIECPKKSST